MADAYVDAQETVITGPINFDFTDVSTEPPANRWHIMSVDKGEVLASGPDSKVPGSLYVKFGGPIVDESDPDDGRWLWGSAMLEGKGQDMSVGFFAACGIDVTVAKQFSSVTELLDEVLGSLLEVRTKIEADKKGNYPDKAEIKAYRQAVLGQAVPGFPDNADIPPF